MANDNNNPNMPWYNMFPHSEYSIRNIDWIIKKYGEYNYRINQLEESDEAQNTTLDDHERRIGALETFEADITPRVNTLETDVSGLQGAVSRIDNELTDINEDINDINSDIENFGGRIISLEKANDSMSDRLEGAEGRITALENGQGTIDSDIEELTREVNGLSNDVSGIDSRVTDIEAHSVIANPGGTGVTLNTLEVDGTVYSVPQGGGGGGSIVTPNPTGTPTGDLTSIGIDAAIFSIPTGVDTTELIADVYDPNNQYTAGDYCVYNDVLYVCNDNTTGAFDPTKWTATNAVEEIKETKAAVNTVDQKIDRIGAGYVDMSATVLDNTPNVQTKFDTLARTLTPGIWLLTFNAKFDTSNYGSRYREIDCYIRDTTNPNNEFTIADNQFTIWGTEAATITAAAVTDCFGFISVAEGQTRTVVPAVNCRPSSGSQTYDVVGKFSCVCIKATS